MLNKTLFKHVDNSPLIIFRIFFGLLCFLESVGAIFTGWVKKVFIDPQFTFSFIGFEWLQPLPHYYMYVYYSIMGLFALGVMVGYKYRISILSFTVMWTATYLMQKSSYNNHYYLLMLISSIMVFMPANTYASIDAKQNKKIKSYSMPRWCVLVFILQLAIVYTFASLAKLYPDWLDTTVIDLLMRSKQNYIIIGEILQQKWIHYLLAYGGILFDGLIIPLLLFKPTRKWGFIISVLFHLFNSFVFQIGVFPYLSLAFSVFFFKPKTVQQFFFKNKIFYDKDEVIVLKNKTPLALLFLIYFLFQIGLPLRHHFIKGNVLWTEEGHKLSWRMMLRTKNGIATYIVKNKKTGNNYTINLNNYLTPKQQQIASSRPDAIWQFSQKLKNEYKTNGQDIAVYVNCKVSVNGKPFKTLINPKIDIANVNWNYFKHNDWVLTSKQK